ncbi:hypothetical protein GCM10022253_24100 [Sphingomonas endophytica]|uniref:Uncharacterized protein n=1 Tax=Sphingomonas endophytica TaxID=869719 RepID=A0ABR6N2N5_9SPHN|nr:phage tail protein [Sphingomonas endophytica]MBB5725058.1 hypothetical protein [Sphingomonas endophytica]
MSGVSSTVAKIAGVVAVAALALSTAGVGAVAGVSLKAVASYAALTASAASVAAQVTAKIPPRQGSVSQTTIGSDQDSPWLVGRTYYGGARVHLVGYGATLKKVKNPYLLAADVHSVGGPVDGLEGIYADLAPVVMRNEVPVAGTNGYFYEHLWRSFQLGEQAERTALPLRFPGAPGWGADARLSGKAAIAYNALFDREGQVFASGLAQMGAVWRGARCWNPVEDSTYPGGNGASRWAPPADTAGHDAARVTWTFTRSPGLLALRYALGIYERDPRVAGSTYRKTFGVGIPLDGLIVEQFVHLHNVCAANNWNCDGVLFEPSSSKWDNLKRILAAGGAEPCWIGGRLGVRVNAPRVAVDTITASDLADGEIVVGVMQGWEQRLNTIVPKYRSETHRWEYVATDPVQIATYLAEDGEEKREERQYDLVQDPTQARQLAAYELLDRRELGEIELPCKPRLRRYGPGDLLTINLPDAGLVEQPAVVLRRTLDPATMGVTLVLRGETMAKHDFALGRTGTPPPTPALVATPSLDGIALERPTSWDAITDPAGTKPQDGADVTADAIDHARFALVTHAARIGTERRARFDPLFWTCNFPNTMMASLRAKGDELRVDAVFHERDHLVGVIWESEDRFDHPATGYDTDRDYRGCVLRFRLRLRGDVLPIDDVDGPVLTIEGRDAAGTPRTWYVRLVNAQRGGSATDAQIELDFDRLKAGFYGTDDVYAGDIDRLFLSFVPTGYRRDGGRLATRVEGGMILSEVSATGAAATLVCGSGPGGTHEVRMTNGYDDTYNVAPARILRNLRLLGYRRTLSHYVGMSHYFSWTWSEAEARYVADDVAQPLNTPCIMWHQDFAEQLHAAGIRLIISVSYEMLDAFAPRAFRQLDEDGAPALTGWTPPSTLFSPCHAGAMTYLQRVARQFCGIAAAAGHDVHFQVGEPWYWIAPGTLTPSFYDAATVARFQSETGNPPPVIASMAGAKSEAERRYLDWLGTQLAQSILALAAAVRADHPDMTNYALLYLPQLLGDDAPEARRVNMPSALAWPALDVLQLEDYDFVIEDRPDRSATARAIVEERLGYPRSRQHYFAGFALVGDSGPVWRSTSAALQAAYDEGVAEVFVWAYTQVLRDGYVPTMAMAPRWTLADVLDVDLTSGVQGGDVLIFDAARRKWLPHRPPVT